MTTITNVEYLKHFSGNLLRRRVSQSRDCTDTRFFERSMIPGGFWSICWQTDKVTERNDAVYFYFGNILHITYKQEKPLQYDLTNNTKPTKLANDDKTDNRGMDGRTYSS